MATDWRVTAASSLTAHFDILGWLDTFLGSPQLQKERQ